MHARARGGRSLRRCGSDRIYLYMCADSERGKISGEAPLRCDTRCAGTRVRVACKRVQFRACEAWQRGGSRRALRNSGRNRTSGGGSLRTWERNGERFGALGSTRAALEHTMRIRGARSFLGCSGARWARERPCGHACSFRRLQPPCSTVIPYKLLQRTFYSFKKLQKNIYNMEAMLGYVENGLSRTSTLATTL